MPNFVTSKHKQTNKQTNETKKMAHRQINRVYRGKKGQKDHSHWKLNDYTAFAYYKTIENYNGNNNNNNNQTNNQINNEINNEMNEEINDEMNDEMNIDRNEINQRLQNKIDETWESLVLTSFFLYLSCFLSF